MHKVLNVFPPRPVLVQCIVLSLFFFHFLFDLFLQSGVFMCGWSSSWHVLGPEQRWEETNGGVCSVQVAGAGAALGPKGEKGEPAVIEPVSFMQNFTPK